MEVGELSGVGCVLTDDEELEISGILVIWEGVDRLLSGAFEEKRVLSGLEKTLSSEASEKETPLKTCTGSLLLILGNTIRISAIVSSNPPIDPI